MAVVDWQQYTQSVFFGLIVSFLLAKLFSAVFSVRDENLRLTRANPNEEQPLVIPSEARWKSTGDDKELAAELPKKHVSHSDSDDDWEGVESTELDDAFSAATAFVAATAADRSSQKVSKALQLRLYGLYKIATQGPCSVQQPSAIKITARAKWNAWRKLGAMPPEEAMQKYLDIISELYPNWADGSTSKRMIGDNNEPSSQDSRPMGPVFSSFIHEEESGNELKLEAIHDFAREGDMEKLLKSIEDGVSVDTKDSEGRTPLHWAVDRGHIDAAELLLSRNADANIKDNDGQTALHYAAISDQERVAELLVKRNAETDIKDDDGNYPSDLSDSNWPWIQP